MGKSVDKKFQVRAVPALYYRHWRMYDKPGRRGKYREKPRQKNGSPDSGIGKK